MSFSHHVQLGYLGLLPFLFLTGGYFFTEAAWLLQSFIIYSASIASFVAGSMWQPPLQLSKVQANPSPAPAQSHFQAWMVVLVTLPLPLGVFVSQSVALIWLAMSFIGLLILQKRLNSWSSLSKEYQQMRAKITSVVFVCHLFMFAQLNHSGVAL